MATSYFFQHASFSFTWARDLQNYARIHERSKWSAIGSAIRVLYYYSMDNNIVRLHMYNAFAIRVQPNIFFAIRIQCRNIIAYYAIRKISDNITYITDRKEIILRTCTSSSIIFY